MAEEFFHMQGICKSYRLADEDVPVLRGINLDIERGEYLSVLGPSGSGKSTLMNIIGCLDVPTEGEYILHGQRVEELDELDKQKALYQLMSKLNEAEISIREEGTVSADDLEAEFGV